MKTGLEANGGVRIGTGNGRGGCSQAKTTCWFWNGKALPAPPCLRLLCRFRSCPCPRRTWEGVEPGRCPSVWCPGGRELTRESPPECPAGDLQQLTLTSTRCLLLPDTKFPQNFPGAGSRGPAAREGRGQLPAPQVQPPPGHTQGSGAGGVSHAARRWGDAVVWAARRPARSRHRLSQQREAWGAGLGSRRSGKAWKAPPPPRTHTGRAPGAGGRGQGCSPQTPALGGLSWSSLGLQFPPEPRKERPPWDPRASP